MPDLSGDYVIPDDNSILILDDALSAVDTHTEEQIIHAITQGQHRQTRLVVAHRLSSVLQAERILVLREGRIIQSGTHQHLAEQDGWYRQLWNAQRSMEEAHAAAA